MVLLVSDFLGLHSVNPMVVVFWLVADWFYPEWLVELAAAVLRYCYQYLCQEFAVVWEILLELDLLALLVAGTVGVMVC